MPGMAMSRKECVANPNSRNKSGNDSRTDLAPRVKSQRRMSYPIGACPLYFGISSPVLDRQQHNKHKGDEAAGTGDSGQTIIEGAPVSTAREARVTEAGNYRFFAGWRSDPFFFDTMGALNNLRFTGADFFAVKDVCSIVLEVPNSALVPKKMSPWHRTVDGASGKWVQADRGALPSQSVFLTGEEKAAYLASQPADDARFVAVFAHSFEHTGNYTPEKQRGSHGRFCRTSAFMIPRGRCPILAMAGHSRTTSWMASFPSSQMEG
jgi:hypothetical protein